MMRLLLPALLALALLLPVLPARAGGGDIPVFVYHRFGDSRYPSTNIPVETFAEQLEYLRREGIPVHPLGEIVRRLRSGEPLPERGVVLTVDDSYASFLTGALPLLKRYNVPATLFVSTVTVGKPGYLSWDDLAAVARSGVEIGNHSHSHPHLVNRRAGESESDWLGRVADELERSQALFREHLGTAPQLFAYPFGEFTPEIVELVGRSGFLGAAVQTSGVVSTSTSPWLVPRFPMGGGFATLRGFIDKAGMRALPVTEVDPVSPLLTGANPPRLRLRLAPGSVRVAALQCFVDGERLCRVEEDGEGWLRIVAERPLTGRRSKLTLTAPAPQGGWFWFSHLWIRPERPE